MAAIWTYADQSDVEELIDAENVAALFETAGVLDEAKLTAAGRWSDSYINSKLRKSSYTVPLAGMDAEAEILIADISARLTAWWGYQKHGVRDAEGQRRVPGAPDDPVAAIYQNHKNIADNMLAELISGDVVIVADEDPDDTTGDNPGSFSFIPRTNDLTDVDSSGDENAH